jgi:hypothetical protein
MTNREEVAKKLRENSTVHTTDEAYVVLLNCMGITYDYSDLFNRLADLIDPTCTADIKREDDGIDAQPYYTSSCGNCGALWDTITGAALLPKYCPHCGARVVNHA